MRSTNADTDVAFFSALGTVSSQQAPLVGQIQVSERKQDIQFGDLFSKISVSSLTVMEQPFDNRENVLDLVPN